MLIEKSNQAISTINTELADMPTTVNKILKFLNSKSKYEFDDLGVDDKTETILEVKKVLTKKNLIVGIWYPCVDGVNPLGGKQTWTFGHRIRRGNTLATVA